MSGYPFLKFVLMLIVTVALLILCVHPFGFAFVFITLSETNVIYYVGNYWEQLITNDPPPTSYLKCKK